MDKQRCGQQECITLNDVDKLRKKLKQGDRLRFWEPVIYNDEAGGQAHHKYRKASGLIVRKYPWLVYVKKKNGKMTSVTYVDLLLWKKKKRRKYR